MGDSSWSLSLGRWSGVHLRLHITLPLLLLCALLMSEFSIYQRAQFEVERVALIVLLGLIAVATHAISHVLCAEKYGIESRELVLGPWGEWNPVASPPTPEAALNTHLAGVMANAFVCALTALVLWLAGDRSIGEMLIPLDSRLLLEQDNRLILVRWIFCLNYSLVLMNLLPSAPFDGSRILKSLLKLSLPQLSDARVRWIVTFTGRSTGVVLILVAVQLGLGDVRGLLPAWFPLTVLGLIALFASDPPEPEKQAVAPPAAEAPLAVPDEPAAPTELPPPGLFLEGEDGPFSQWLEERRQSQRDQREARQEEELSDERRVDEILGRLHAAGPDALSAEDRAILDRVSDRLRRRQQENS